MSSECSDILNAPPEEASWLKSSLASLGSASRAVLLGATALVSVCASDPASRAGEDDDTCSGAAAAEYPLHHGR